MSQDAPRLKHLLAAGGLLPMAGIYDALSARLAEQAGLPMAFLSGYCLSATMLGLPDFGFITLTELVETAARIADRVRIPVIADGDNGFGGPLSVGRLVRDLERAGIAGVQIEDQSAPKRCGHMEGKRLVSHGEMVGKIKAALDARRNESFAVIARTDAVAVDGFEEAVDRALAYERAGADAIFIEAPETEEQIRRIPGLFARPTVFNFAIGGKSPLLPVQDLAALGYRLVQCPDVIFAISKTLVALYGEIARSGTYAALIDRMTPFADFNAMLGLADIAERERRYGPGA
jgi:2-methylisocitrate lyase-like PEP mutase family enzyme